MNPYKEFQFGWIIIGIMIPIQILMTYLYLNDIGNNPISQNGYIAINLLFAPIYFLFYGFKTTVTKSLITLSFGIGIIKKRIKTEQIADVVIVRNPGYYGWGIRLVPNGLMYNIGGFDAG